MCDKLLNARCKKSKQAPLIVSKWASCADYDNQLELIQVPQRHNQEVNLIASQLSLSFSNSSNT